MAKLIYAALTSLDGYVADETGNFDWAEPDEEVHAFVNDLERAIGTYLFGRKMYETMAVWETPDVLPHTPCCPWAIDHHSNPRRNTMIVEAQVTINGSKAAIWAAITNIENASETMSGIENIEVLEKPASGLVGLKWRETRMLFGKTATAEKWITDAAENEFYKTRAESDG